MHISIHSNGFVLTEALRAYTKRRLVTALGWAATRLRKLHVSLSDINGPRGGRDKRCKIQVQLAGGKHVLIEDTEADLYQAIDRAAGRADRALARRVEHQREAPHVRLAAPGALATVEDKAGDDR